MLQPDTQELEGRLDNDLPELKFSQVAKTSGQILRVSPEFPLNPEMGLIQPAGEYTVVLAPDGENIRVFDKTGNKIEGLKGMQMMILDWVGQSRTPSGGWYEFLGIDKASIGQHIFHRTKAADTLQPPRSREAVKAYLQKNLDKDATVTRYPQDNWQLSTKGQVQIATGEGYIIFHQPATTQFIAFQTKDERGVDLSPENWKRFDTLDEWAGRCPSQITTEVEHLRVKGLTVGQQTKNGFYVSALEDRLVVTKPGQEIEAAEFTDRLAGIGNNICEDPRNPGVIYYCNRIKPTLLMKLDTTKDPKSWVTESEDIPLQYSTITNLRFDPTGNFFTFRAHDEFVILAKDTLQEIKKIPDLKESKLDETGKIKGINKEGRLVIYEVNFQEVAQELEKRRVEKLAQGLSIDDLFQKKAESASVNTDQFQDLLPIKTKSEAKFSEQLQTITSLDGMSSVTEALAKLRVRLQSEGLQPGQVAFITQGIEDEIKGKEQILAQPIVAQGLVDLNTKLTGHLTIATIAEVKGDITKLKAMEGLVDDATRAKIHALENQFSQESAEFFRREGTVIEADVSKMVGGVKIELEKMGSMVDFGDWQEFTLPQLISRLGTLANDCPLEAHETQKKILAARRQLQELSSEYGKRFNEKYAVVREKASEIIGERVELMKVDIESLADRLRARGFKDRSQAEIYVKSSEALEALKTEISELAKQNPDAAKELDRELKVRLATIMSEIERGGLTSIAETGQQMILFGDTLFPKWEGKVQEKVQRHIDLMFIPDEKTKGPGVSADQVLGDIGVMEINSRGKLDKKRLYEGIQNEDEWRYGSVSYRGEYVFPSYVSQAEYRKIKQDYTDWNKGDGSKIRQALSEKRQALKEWYSQRKPISERDTQSDDKWGEEYKELLTDYAKYSAENHALLLSRIDQLRKAPETEFANGSGYVPEWQSHWTTDETTEHYLEKMAQAAKMQLDLQEGLLNLKGHAGTGKDVLIKMFCNRSNRPYFAIDCSKWTTEFELSEDVVLEAEDGASKTVKVPSVVLNAITTPGAVMYFNEINAMPEQAQIFLHGLMDEKRTLTLKTSSGKAVRTLNSVILMGSMNPGYPGTFNPQFATKSRMVGLEIDYPPLYREKAAGDLNPNPPISAAEALRVARQVDSLADYTYEVNPQHNEFVQIWDRHINGIETGAPDLTKVQKFDLEVILTMVEFAQKLREGFILKFEKARASSIPRGTLLVDQPITGREMRRMAYTLSKMSPEEKATANPEAITRSLIERFFLSHIDKRDEKDEIRTAMKTWTSSKRPAA